MSTAKYRAENKQLIKDQKRAYNRTDTGKLSQLRHTLRQKCKRRGIPCDLTLDVWKSKPRAGIDTCPQCQKIFGLKRSDLPSIDRIVPSLGYVFENIEWICVECNRLKSNLTYEQMIEFGTRGVARLRERKT